MLIIGAEFSGPELPGTPIDKAISATMQAEEVVSNGFEAGMAPAVNVVFCVPGKFGKPDWEGLRIGRFSKSKKLVLVQVAVPEDMVHSAVAMDFVLKSLTDADSLGADFFEQKGMSYSVAESKALLARIQDLVKTTRTTELN